MKKYRVVKRIESDHFGSYQERTVYVVQRMKRKWFFFKRWSDDCSTFWFKFFELSKGIYYEYETMQDAICRMDRITKGTTHRDTVMITED